MYLCSVLFLKIFDIVQKWGKHYFAIYIKMLINIIVYIRNDILFLN